MDIANAIGAYNQLQGWHLVIFAVITVAIARPEWVRAIYNRLIGNGRKPATNGWATKADFQTIATRLDNHEAECVKRNAVIQRDIDGLKTDVSNIKTDIAAMRTDIKWIGKTLGYRNRNGEEFSNE